MKTILQPCQVPWAVSPSSSGITLTHTETDVIPECKIVFGGGRRQPNNLYDSRLIEIVFAGCYFARTGPHGDLESIDDVGFDVDRTVIQSSDFQRKSWPEPSGSRGCDPDSGFYVATHSVWLNAISPLYSAQTKHYVIDGRDGYVEVLAKGFEWREWKWENCHRDKAAIDKLLLAVETGSN